MENAQINSDAFHIAELSSEKLRIIGVLGFMGLLVIVTGTRLFVVRTLSTNDARLRGSLVFIVSDCVRILDAGPR
jgi:hypothetical protein